MVPPPLLDMPSVIREGKKRPYFDTGYYSGDKTIERFKMLRDQNVPTEIDFIVSSDWWGEKITDEMIQTLEHHKSLGRQWNELRVTNDFSEYIQMVIQAPVTTQLFRKFSFSSRERDIPMDKVVSTSISSILKSGRQVESLVIQNYEIGQDAMAALAEGLVSFSGDLVLDNVYFYNDEESLETRSTEQILADCLARNNALPSFSFSFDELSGSATAMIIRTLIGHQSLKKLQFRRPEIGEAPATAICSLLSSQACTLTDLEISGHLHDHVFSDDEDEPSPKSKRRKIEQCVAKKCIEQRLADGLARNKSLASFRFGCFATDSTTALILRSLIGHQSLKKLHLNDVKVGEATATAIQCLLLSQQCKLSDVTISVTRNNERFDYERFNEQLPVNVEESVTDGRAGNRTLTSFSLCCKADDSATAVIVQSLVGQESLKKLQLSQNTVGEATATAICGLLGSQRCQLSDLSISKVEIGFDYERFGEQLPFNTSLQSLKLSSVRPFIGNDNANRLLQSFWKLSNLQCLDLTENRIGDLSLLGRNVAATTPHSCLRVLNLDENRFHFRGQYTSAEELKAQDEAFLHLLQVFPELHDFGKEIAKKMEQKFLSLSPSVTERIDLNRCSGTLLRGGPELPLSVWAIVLDKVNRDPISLPALTPSRKANVMYHMLHGPVFVGRGLL